MTTFIRTDLKSDKMWEVYLTQMVMIAN